MYKLQIYKCLMTDRIMNLSVNFLQGPCMSLSQYIHNELQSLTHYHNIQCSSDVRRSVQKLMKRIKASSNQQFFNSIIKLLIRKISYLVVLFCRILVL